MVRRAKNSGEEELDRKLLPNRIAEVRDSRGWNQLQLAGLVGTSQQSISRYETSQRDFAVSVLTRLCEVLEVSASYLLCIDDENPPTADVPLFGSIAAGTPIDMDACDDHCAIPAIVHERFPDTFLLRVEGDSMNRIMPNGSIALVNPGTEIDYEGQPYAVCVNDLAATIKRVRHIDQGILLIPDSTDPSYQTQVLTRGVDDMTVSVIGRVVWHRKPESQR